MNFFKWYFFLKASDIFYFCFSIVNKFSDYDCESWSHTWLIFNNPPKRTESEAGAQYLLIRMLFLNNCKSSICNVMIEEAFVSTTSEALWEEFCRSRWVLATTLALSSIEARFLSANECHFFSHFVKNCSFNSTKSCQKSKRFWVN